MKFNSIQFKRANGKDEGLSKILPTPVIKLKILIVPVCWPAPAWRACSWARTGWGSCAQCPQGAWCGRTETRPAIQGITEWINQSIIESIIESMNDTIIESMNDTIIDSMNDTIIYSIIESMNATIIESINDTIIYSIKMNE